MLTLPRSVGIYLARQPVDMRCGFDALSQRVIALGHDVYTGHLFVFVSRRRDRVKILCWDHGGFVLWYKRLERGRFQVSFSEGATEMKLDGPSLAMLLDGIDCSHVRRPRHWQPKLRDNDRHSATDVIQTHPDVT